MRILIVGSSGQLGTEVARQLSATHEIVGIDLTAGKWTHHLVNIITGRDALKKVLQDVEAVIHIASLHGAHLTTHSKQSFVDTNITGTLNLLETAVQVGIRRFVYTSTTSLYGHALVPRDQAVWVTEALTPRPRDIYDITKTAAEELYRHFALTQGISVICLRTSRFFSEPQQLITLYRLYRGVDVRDVAAAHLLAVTKGEIQFDAFNISAHSPFQESDLPALFQDAPSVLRHRAPELIRLFARRGWELPASIDRVYVIAKAQRLLGYQPLYSYPEYLQDLQES